MTISEMFGQSGTLALLGMGIVFSFLLILILFMSLVAKVIARLGLDKDSGAAASPNTGAGAAGTGAAGTGAAVTAAISAAVQQHRKKNN